MSQRTVALLNDVTEAEVARAMIQQVDQKLRAAEQTLTHTQLDREIYLTTISRATVLREILAAQTELYRRAFER
jgi:hypothetical protein